MPPIVSLDERLDAEEPKIVALQSLTASHTTQISEIELTPGANRDAGETGEKGDAGATGAKGDAGATGAKGDAGATGAKGDVGATGAKGDTGAQGATGPQGESGTGGTDLNSTSNIITGTISCGNLTGRTGTTITAPTIIASSNLLYGSSNTNVATKIGKLETNIAAKQNFINNND